MQLEIPRTKYTRCIHLSAGRNEANHFAVGFVTFDDINMAILAVVFPAFKCPVVHAYNGLYNAKEK
jgi:hypothetical protein